MNPSEDPSDRLVDSLLREHARGKPDEALLRAIESKIQAAPSSESQRGTPGFFWPATAAAVILLTAGTLLWNGGEEPPEPETGRHVHIRAETPDETPKNTGDTLPVVGPKEAVAEHGEMVPPVIEPEIAGDGDQKPVLDQGSGEQEQVLELDALRFVREESTSWYVLFGLESRGNWAPRLVGLTVAKERLTNRVPAVEMLVPGEVFFREGPMAGRFKFLGFGERQVVSERTKFVQTVKFAEYEDLKPNKKGERYESRYGLPNAQVDGSAYHDRTAVLEFQGKEFEVEERTRFTLPPGGKGQKFFLKEVTKDRIVIEYIGPDGRVDIREISR